MFGLVFSMIRLMNNGGKISKYVKEAWEIWKENGFLDRLEFI